MPNMLEKKNSNLQTKFVVHVTANIFKTTKFYNESREYTNSQPPNTLKANPYPGEVGDTSMSTLT